MKNLIWTIKAIRRFHNFKQIQIAEKICVSLRTYQRKESGHCEFTHKEILLIAELFKLTYEQLTHFAPENSSSRQSEEYVIKMLEQENAKLKNELSTVKT